MLMFGEEKIVGLLNFVVLAFGLLTFSNGVFSDTSFGEECVLNDEDVGSCVPFSECPSAIRLARNGVKPVFCDDQGETSFVCCEATSTNRRRRTNGNRRHLNDEETRRGAKRWTASSDSDGIESIYDIQRVYQSDNNYFERKKHSITPDANDGTSRNEYNRRKNQEDPYTSPYYTEEPPKYNNKPNRRPNNPNGKLIDYNGSQEYQRGESHNKKKKPHNTEYQYEYVTKKPHYERTTRRNDWQSENYDWQDQNRKTTKRNQWGEETTKRYDWYEDRTTTTRRYDPWANQPTTTTRRYDPWENQPTTKKNHYYEETTKRNQWQNQNNWSIEENTADSYDERTTTRRPHRTTTRRDTYRPTTEYRPTSRPTTDYRPTSRPHHENNNRPEVNRRISEIKCMEYAQEVTETIAGLPLTTDPKPVKINVQKCIHAQQLIVGGENTTVGEFPHMAAVGFRDHAQRGIAWNCGGSLISEEFVLTAAHCTTTSMGPPVMVRLGEYNLKRNDDGAHPVDYSIKEIIKHPDYLPPSKYNDIALLRLSRRVTFHKNIRPACLYTKDTFTTSKTVATGWGRIDYAEDPSEILLKVVLSIIDNQHCNRLYHNTVRSEILSRGIIDTQMCAGELAGGKDTCQGDSGGPIEITSKSNQCVHHIVGITSFGKHCAQPNAPGVYTRVSSYVPWIESIVWPQRG